MAMPTHTLALNLSSGATNGLLRTFDDQRWQMPRFATASQACFRGSTETPKRAGTRETAYYGAPKKSRNQLYYDKPRQGTTKLHAYATASIVVYGYRYTLALS